MSCSGMTLHGLLAPRRCARLAFEQQRTAASAYWHGSCSTTGAHVPSRFIACLVPWWMRTKAVVVSSTAKLLNRMDGLGGVQAGNAPL